MKRLNGLLKNGTGSLTAAALLAATALLAQVGGLAPVVSKSVVETY